MRDETVLLIAYSVQSHGPIASGLMLEGSAHLAARLAKAGYTPRVHDFNTARSVAVIAEQGKALFLRSVIDELAAEVSRRDVRLVGFTLYTNGFSDCVQIARALKARRPELLVAAGGPLVGWLGCELFSLTDAFDVVVPGEGDTAIVALANCAYRGGVLEAVPGAIYQGGEGLRSNARTVEDIRTLPFPLYDEEVYPGFADKLPVSTLRTSVGCRWGRCSFCVQPKLDGKPRERQLEDAAAEIEHLSTRYGIRHFRIADPNPSPERLKQLTGLIGDDIRLSCFLYPETDTDLEWARRHFVALFIGLERTAPADLLALRKTRCPEQHTGNAQRLVSAARSLGLSTCVTNIVPTANDTVSAIEAHRDAVIAMDPDFATVTPLLPIPGSVLHMQALASGSATGVIIDDDFTQKIASWELDLLRPPREWPAAPWRLVVDGAARDPFEVAEQHFVAPLLAAGIGLASDEIVLLASLYNGGLPMPKADKRATVARFQSLIRNAILNHDTQALREIVTVSRGRGKQE